jgi:hypothetical protein
VLLIPRTPSERPSQVAEHPPGDLAYIGGSPARVVQVAHDAALDEQQLIAELAASAENFRTALEERTPEARRVLQALVQDRLEFSPFVNDGGRGYEFVGTGTYGGLLAGYTCPTSNGGPNGNLRRDCWESPARGPRAPCVVGRVLRVSVAIGFFASSLACLHAGPAAMESTRPKRVPRTERQDAALPLKLNIYVLRQLLVVLRGLRHAVDADGEPDSGRP